MAQPPTSSPGTHKEGSATSNQPATRYIITLEAPVTPDDPDGIQRLKRWLKRSWRDYALRCVSIGLAVTKPTSGNELQANETPVDTTGH